MAEIREEHGVYLVTDSSQMEYTSWGTKDMVYIYETRWRWNEQFEMVQFLFDKCDGILHLENKESMDHHRCKRAISRHLSALKEYLGMTVKKASKKEKPKKKFIYTDVRYGGIRVKEGIEHDKTIEFIGTSNEKISKNSLRFTEATPEKLQLMEEYQAKAAAFKAYQKQVFEELFGKEESITLD